MTVMPSRPSTFRTPEARPRPAASVLPGGSVSTINPLRVLRRHMFTIIGAAVLGGIIGVGAFFGLDRLYPLYTAEHLFEIRPGLREASEIGANEFANDDMVARLAQTEALKLNQRRVLRTAVETSDVRGTEWFQTFMISTGSGPETYDFEAAVDELEEDIRTPVIRGTHFFGVRWTWHKAKDIPVVLDAIAKAYLALRADEDAEVYDRDLDAFSNSLRETQTQLEVLTREISQYVRDKGIVAFDTDARSSVPAFELEELVKQRGEAMNRLIMTQSTLEQTRKKLEGQLEPSLDDRKEAELDFSVSYQMRLQLEAQTEYQRALIQHGADHPSTKHAKSQLDAASSVYDDLLEQTINRNLQSNLKEFGNLVESLDSTITTFDADMIALEAELNDLAGFQTEYMNMETQRDNLEEARKANRELINQLRLMKTRADAQRIRTAKPAETPREKSFPKPMIVIPVSVLLLVGLTVGFIFLREMMDQRVKSASDIMVLPGAQLLATIPEMSEDPTHVTAAELAVRKHPQSVLAESYRQAATTINITMERAGHQTMMVCGGLPGAGSTAMISNLAAVSASSGRRVIVVDANFRRPTLASVFNAESDGPGLGDLLVGDAVKAEARQKTEYDVDVISAGTPGNRVFERLSNGRLDSLIAELRAEYDVILFDVPPAVVAGDAMVIADRVDAAVMVVRAHREQRGLIGRLIQQFSSARCELLGIVLNRPLGTAGGYFKKNYKAMASYASTG